MWKTKKTKIGVFEINLNWKIIGLGGILDFENKALDVHLGPIWFNYYGDISEIYDGDIYN